VTLDGRKLVGSAQRRISGALLQQGSVLLGPGHLRLVDYLAIPEAARARERERLRASATDAGAHLAPDAPLERWADALMRELAPGTRRIDGPAALTLPEAAPYTAPAARTEA
jgi:lipoate-protein ligase A